VVLAVGFTAATAFGQRGQVTLRPGQSGHFAGQTLSYEGIATLRTASHSAIEALVSVDHSAPFRPAISRYGPSPIGVGTPAIDTTITHDVYLTVVDLPKTPKGPATIGVVVQPGILWLWIGAGIMALGTLLALFPTRKRRGPVVPRASDTVVSSHGGPGGVEVDGASHAKEGSDRPRVAELVG
jgi:cytochrome c-type biogenesis protein CcmF